MQNSSLLHRQDALGDSQDCAHGGLRSGIVQSGFLRLQLNQEQSSSGPLHHSSIGMVGVALEQSLNSTWVVGSIVARTETSPTSQTSQPMLFQGLPGALVPSHILQATIHQSQSRPWESSCLTASLFIIRVGIQKRERAHY